MQGSLPTDSTGISRRDFMRLSGAVGGVALLAACGAGSLALASPSAKPKRGGTLRIGILGGSSSDTIEADAAVGTPDYARIAALYNTLTTFDENANIVPVLAESVEYDSTGTIYTIRLRQGVTFHNGKPLTPADVIFTFQRIISKGLAGAPALSGVNFNNIKTLDPLTLQLTLDHPSVLLKLGFANYFIQIVPVGYDPKNPIGTGPFKFQSFTPGQQSTFIRNENYFDSPKPYLDSLEIVDFPDATARLNAFTTGQLDAIDSVASAQVSALKAQSQINLLTASTGLAIVNYMRCDAAPFNDVRVRQAMQLIMDRPKMIEVAGDGQGTLGDDVLGKYFPSYDTSLPQRHQDLDKARSLLQQAGHSGMTVQLTTADFISGSTEQAALLAQFASAAGFTITLNTTTEGNIFGSNYVSSNYAGSWLFSQDFITGADYLYNASLSLITGALYNETHFSNPQFDKLYQQANATPDDAMRYEIIHEMQQIDYNEGGYLIPYYDSVTDAHSKKFAGFQTASKVGYSFNDYDFSGVWQL
jgi:peptide/nickel transport system substrate-binding protein